MSFVLADSILNLVNRFPYYYLHFLIKW